MTWFPVDDRFHSHPKAAAASLAALGLWTLAGSWANDHLQDGNVPEHMALLLSRGATELADELVTVGLWRRTKTGYRFHQWDERNATRSEVTAARQKKSSGGVLGNHRRWHTKAGVADPDCLYCQQKQPPGTDRYSDRSTESVSDADANPPLPFHSSTKKNKPSSSAAPTETDPAFVEFWAAYPRRAGKPAAVKAWRAAMKRGDDPAAITGAAHRYAAERVGQDPQYTAHPATWLNQQRYNDQPERPSRLQGGGGWWNN